MGGQYGQSNKAAAVAATSAHDCPTAAAAVAAIEAIADDIHSCSNPLILAAGTHSFLRLLLQPSHSCHDGITPASASSLPCPPRPPPPRPRHRPGRYSLPSARSAGYYPPPRWQSPSHRCRSRKSLRSCSCARRG
eukprot:TRINITY_DN40696_c0_g5_i1.p2 TRINITY_DN40696_c0_g5~~TRINITY_DN40696_c0_g5_i1.p2  ORF type:complete len:135 (-),score=13.91 TRINITY_DN40696_c0_g5_i1:283-687(-)